MADECAAVLALLLCDVRWDVRDSALDAVSRIAQLVAPGVLNIQHSYLNPYVICFLVCMCVFDLRHTMHPASLPPFPQNSAKDIVTERDKE